MFYSLKKFKNLPSEQIFQNYTNYEDVFFLNYYKEVFLITIKKFFF